MKPADAERAAAWMPRWMPARRAALGIAAQSAPALAFVLAGVALGPAGLNLISVTVLAQLDPVVSVALAVLGIFVGSGLSMKRSSEKWSWMAGAGIHAVVTVAVTGIAMFYLFTNWGLPLPGGIAASAAILGLCTSVSAAVRVDDSAGSEMAAAAHLADLDDIAVILMAAAAVPVIAGVAFPAVALAGALVAGTAVAIAASLLLIGAHNASERGVFVLGSVILLGGGAAYASASPLITGAIAGFLWSRGRSETKALIESELRRLQHPLVALLLIIAGASMQFSYALLWIAAPLVLVRFAGKLLGSMILARLFSLPAGLVGTLLIPPGVLGIALALNFQQVLSTGDTLLLSAVTAAAAASEILSIAVWQHEEGGGR